MKALRQTLRQQRRNITPFDRIRLAKNILSQVQKVIHFHSRQKVAIYLPNDGEIDPKYIQDFVNLLKNKYLFTNISWKKPSICKNW